jgi:uncharacterized protein
VDPGPLEIAASVAEMLRDERFSDIENLFAPRLRAAVSAETIRTAWTAEAAKIGPVTAVGAPVGEPLGDGLVRVSTPVAGQRGGLTVVVSVDGAGRLNGFRLAPPGTAAWTPPRYAASARSRRRRGGRRRVDHAAGRAGGERRLVARDSRRGPALRLAGVVLA